MKNGIQRVVWREGMFLKPQHFQQESLCQQRYAFRMAELQHPDCWGVENLAIDLNRLQNGYVSIKSGAVLFRDGSYVEIPNTASVIEREVPDDSFFNRDQFGLFLGLRILQATESNLGDLEASKPDSIFLTRRFTERNAKQITQDWYLESEKTEVAYSRFQLLPLFEFELENASEFELVKIGELKFTATTIGLNQRFVHPILNFNMSPTLVEMLEDLRQYLNLSASDIKSLTEKYSDTETVIKRFTKLYVLRNDIFSLIGAVTNILSNKSLPPRFAFERLYEVSLRIVNDDEDTNGIRYDHEDIWSSFSSLIQLIRKSIHDEIRNKNKVLPFVLDGEYLSLNIGSLGEREDLVISFFSKDEHSGLREIIESQLKISTKDYLPVVVARSLPGFSYEVIDELPSNMKVEPTTTYIRVHFPKNRGDQAEVKEISLFMDCYPKDLRVELIVNE